MCRSVAIVELVRYSVEVADERDEKMSHKADVQIYPLEAIQFSRITIGMLCSPYGQVQPTPSNKDTSGWKEPDVFTKIAGDKAYNLRTCEVIHFSELEKMTLVYLKDIGPQVF